MRGYICQCVSQIHAELHFKTCHKLLPLHQSLLTNDRHSYTDILLYITNLITHFTRTALHDSRKSSDFCSKFIELMFPCSSFMYCCHPEPLAHHKQQDWDLAITEHSIPLLTVLLLRDFRNNVCKFLLCEQLQFHADNYTDSRNRTAVYKLWQMCVN